MLRVIKENILGIKKIHQDIRVYLNVLREMGFKHIHFGYWDKTTEDFPDAQDNLYQLLKSFIPSHAKNILDIGGGIGGISFLLAKDGYKPVCVVPDKLLIKEGEKRFPNITFLKGTAEFFESPTKGDLALLVESYQYFTHNYRALLNIINQLTKNGHIMILDEFSTVRRGPLNELDLVHFLTKKRYFLERRLDITENIFPTCEYLEDYFKNKNYAFSLKWWHNKQKYLNNRSHYLLLLFKFKEGGNPEKINE